MLLVGDWRRAPFLRVVDPCNVAGRPASGLAAAEWDRLEELLPGAKRLPAEPWPAYELRRNPFSRRRGRQKAKIASELRSAVFARDGEACLRCGAMARLSCDHVEPESKGGPTVLENLQTLCRSCNSRKGSKRVVDYRRREQLALEAA